MIEERADTRIRRIVNGVRVYLLLAGYLILLFPALSRADYLEVSRNANLYTRPTTESTILFKARPGQLLALERTEPVEGYYAVTVPGTDRTAYVYRTLVRGHRGELPEATATPVLPEQPLLPGLDSGSGPELAWAAKHLAVGKPTLLHERVREGYAVGYDSRLNLPVWVQYSLGPEDLQGPELERRGFRTDPTIPLEQQGRDSDYTRSGYARGHLAPAEDQETNQQRFRESFYLSNCVPQIQQDFNAGVWSELEQRIRRWAGTRELTIIAGPVFAPENGVVRYRVIGEEAVAVPTHLYKIVADLSDKTSPRLLAFLFENREHDGADPEDPQFHTSVDEIERLTGIDFLPALEDSWETKLEAAVADTLW